MTLGVSCAGPVVVVQCFSWALPTQDILRFYGFIWFHSNRMFGTGQKLARTDTNREVWEKFGTCWFFSPPFSLSRLTFLKERVRKYLLLDLSNPCSARGGGCCP